MDEHTLAQVDLGVLLFYIPRAYDYDARLAPRVMGGEFVRFNASLRRVYLSNCRQILPTRAMLHTGGDQTNYDDAYGTISNFDASHVFACVADAVESARPAWVQAAAAARQLLAFYEARARQYEHLLSPMAQRAALATASETQKVSGRRLTITKHGAADHDGG